MADLEAIFRIVDTLTPDELEQLLAYLRQFEQQPQEEDVNSGTSQPSAKIIDDSSNKSNSQ